VEKKESASKQGATSGEKETRGPAGGGRASGLGGGKGLFAAKKERGGLRETVSFGREGGRLGMVLMWHTTNKSSVNVKKK